MRSGMVRKVDELGRIVIPKEMRRVLGIKTGASIEVDLNDDNEIVLRKFSELSNMPTFANKLVDIIFSAYSVPCVTTDGDEIVFAKGLSKNDVSLVKVDFDEVEVGKLSKVVGVRYSKKTYKYAYITKLESSGFEYGYLVLFMDSEIDKDLKKNIEVLCRFASDILQ